MSAITILIPTSPIPSHPSTAILDSTVNSVRAQLPNSRILITCDGSDDEAYKEYIRRIEDRYENASVMQFPMHVHQSGMLGAALDDITTPLTYFLEHDWHTLPNVPWAELAELIVEGEYNYIKLHAGTRIHPAHEHLMGERLIWHGLEPHVMYQDASGVRGIPVIETAQYSANPHLASTEWYRTLYRAYVQGKTDYIENILHGVLAERAAWDMAIYNPMEGGSMQQVEHLDGRGTCA